MGKSTGLGLTALSVDDAAGTLTDIRGDVTNFEWATPRNVQDVTGVDKSAIERLLLLADMSLTLTGVHNPVGAHLVFSSVPSTSVNREFLITANGVSLGVTGTPTLLPTDYSLTRAAEGSLVYTVPMVLANGVVPTWS